MEKKFTDICKAMLMCFILITIITKLMEHFTPALYYSIDGVSMPEDSLETFITSIILAPLWEEAAWRYAPIEILRKITDFEKIKWPFIIGSGVWFGYWHFGTPSVCIQGVIGMFLAWIYIKNGYSYWSSVIFHAIWNYLFTFILT